MSGSSRHGGLGWGAPAVAAISSAAIVVFVGYLAITHRAVRAEAQPRTDYPSRRGALAPGRARSR